jgi:hypothetical protein
MRWRKLAVGVVDLGAIPVILVLSVIPRRQFNLPRLVRSREFKVIRDESTTWLDRHFELIEQGAPWLHRIGRDVWDTCNGSVPSPSLFDFAPKARPGVGCRRAVTTVYGFDGQETGIPPVAQAFSVAGWEIRRIAGGATLAAWRPGEGIGYPSYGEGMPPWGGKPIIAPEMRVSWLSSGEGTTATRDPNRMHRVTRNYLPLENTKIQLSELLKEALWHHGNAMYVTISFGYYWNPWARGFRHRVPRYLLPTRLAPWAAGLPGTGDADPVI